jgi:hypothetical protein
MSAGGESMDAIRTELAVNRLLQLKQWWLEKWVF